MSGCGMPSSLIRTFGSGHSTMKTFARLWDWIAGLE